MWPTMPGGHTMLETVRNFLEAHYLVLNESRITLLDVVELALALVCLFVAARLLRRFLARFALPRLGLETGHAEALAAMSSYAIIVAGFIVIFDVFGLDLSSMAVIAGGLGVGIGFGLQEITKNFISGMTLLAERKIKVGDFVELDDGSTGHIQEISLRSVVFRTLDGGDVVIPNSYLTDNRVLNWSLDTFKARLRIPVVVTYGSSPLRVTEAVLEAAYAEPAVCSDPEPVVVSKGSRDDPNGADIYELLVWIDRIDKRATIESALQYRIQANLHEYGLTIPFAETFLRNLEVLDVKQERLADEKLDGFYGQWANLPLPEGTTPLDGLLRKVDYFKTLSDFELRQLMEAGVRRWYPESATLFKEGEPGDAFYVVLSGEVDISAKSKGHLTALKDGQFFGEMALLLGIPRSATARTTKESLLFVIDQPRLKKLLERNPTLASALVEAMGPHQEELAQRRKELGEDAGQESTNPLAWARKRLQKIFGLGRAHSPASSIGTAEGASLPGRSP